MDKHNQTAQSYLKVIDPKFKSLLHRENFELSEYLLGQDPIELLQEFNRIRANRKLELHYIYCKILRQCEINGLKESTKSVTNYTNWVYQESCLRLAYYLGQMYKEKRLVIPKRYEILFDVRMKKPSHLT